MPSKTLEFEQIQFRDYAARAWRWRSADPNIVPGLLQTQAYAAMQAGELPSDQRRRIAEDKLQWQALMSAVPGERTFLMGEAALRFYAGTQPVTMRYQLQHLASTIEANVAPVGEHRPRSLLRVVPYAADIMMRSGGVVLLNEGSDAQAIFSEGAISLTRVTRPADEANALAYMNALEEVALSPLDSLGLIQEVARAVAA